MDKYRPRKTVLCLIDRYVSEGRYSISHPVLEDIMAKLLPSRGYRVIWLMQSVEPNSGGKKINWHGSEIHLMPSGDGTRFWGRIWNLLWRIFFLKRFILSTVEENHVDVVQVRNDWVAARAARDLRKLSVPLIFQWSFPHYKVHLARIEDGMSRFPALSRLRASVEKFFYYSALNNSALTLTVSEWFKNELIKEGFDAKKMIPFPLTFDCSIQPDCFDAGETRDRLGLRGKKIILYFGDMTKLRKMDFLVRVMRKVVDEMPEAHLLMVGSGDTPTDLEELKKETHSLGIEDEVTFTGFISRSDIPAYIAAADVGVSPIRPIPLFYISSPTKLVETLGMAKPIVANDIPEQKFLIEESGGGICVPYDETAFSIAILELLKDPLKASEMGSCGRSYIEKNRSNEAFADLLEDIYAKL